MEKSFNYVQKYYKNKSVSLHSFLQIKIFEEIKNDSIDITLRGSFLESLHQKELQKEYIRGFWEYTLLDFLMPKKKFLKEFYISVDIKISYMKFFDWSITKNDYGDVTHLVIESLIPPESDFISGYEFASKLHSNYIYQFNILEIGKIIFTEKPPT